MKSLISNLKFQIPSCDAQRAKNEGHSVERCCLRFARTGIFSFFIFGLIFSGAATLYAAAKMPGKSSGKSQNISSENNPADSASMPETFTGDSKKATAAPAPPTGADSEKLLYTLNETLSENRKIRESMRDLQSAFEKIAIEKSDLLDQVKKVEKLASQRNKDAGRQVDELTAQLEQSKRDMAKLEGDNTASVAQKMELEKKLEALSAEQAKSREVLKKAILTPERDQIVARMNQNDAAVETAVTQIAAMNGQNIALKEQVIQSYFDLGNMYYDLGRYEEAVAQYLHVLEWNPYHAWAHHNLAVIYDYHFHRIRDALVEYKAYMNVRLASEEANEVRIRIWDLEGLTQLQPATPLEKDFKESRKI